ncbi:MAG: hypothetical protein ACRECY_10530 [Phyllobacterium sp.]
MNGRVVQSDNPELAGEKRPAALLATGTRRAGDSADRRRQAASRIDAAKQLVEVARATADSSLLRAKAAPRPHEIGNPAFVALFEAHQRDREVLFAAMRTLEVARRVDADGD